MIRTLGLFAAPRKPNVDDLTRRLVVVCQSRGIAVKMQREIGALAGFPELCCDDDDEIARVDVLVTFSGDGGVLKAARFAAPHQTPVLAVDLGRLGFLSAVRPAEIEAALHRVLDGEFEIEERMMLDARVLRRHLLNNGAPQSTLMPIVEAGEEAGEADGSFSAGAPIISLATAPETALQQAFRDAQSTLQSAAAADCFEVGGSIGLNDAVVAKSALARILKISISIGGELVAQTRADGLVISTPTGSTAYALAAGGPIVDPEVPLLLICPICAHSIAQRPLVIGPDQTIEIQTEWEGDEVSPDVLEAMLTIDGQVGVRLQSGDRVRVQRSPLTARLLKPPANSFFTRLREKLHWI